MNIYVCFVKKNTLEARDFSTKTTTKIKSSSSSNTETSNNNNNNNKRPRNETPTPLPAFKVCMYVCMMKLKKIRLLVQEYICN